MSLQNSIACCLHGWFKLFQWFILVYKPKDRDAQLRQCWPLLSFFTWIFTKHLLVFNVYNLMPCKIRERKTKSWDLITSVMESKTLSHTTTSRKQFWTNQRGRSTIDHCTPTYTHLSQPLDGVFATDQCSRPNRAMPPSQPINATFAMRIHVNLRLITDPENLIFR